MNGNSEQIAKNIIITPIITQLNNANNTNAGTSHTESITNLAPPLTTATNLAKATDNSINVIADPGKGVGVVDNFNVVQDSSTHTLRNSPVQTSQNSRTHTAPDASIHIHNFSGNVSQQGRLSSLSWDATESVLISEPENATVSSVQEIQSMPVSEPSPNISTAEPESQTGQQNTSSETTRSNSFTSASGIPIMVEKSDASRSGLAATIPLHEPDVVTNSTGTADIVHSGKISEARAMTSMSNTVQNTHEVNNTVVEQSTDKLLDTKVSTGSLPEPTGDPVDAASSNTRSTVITKAGTTVELTTGDSSMTTSSSAMKTASTQSSEGIKNPDLRQNELPGTTKFKTGVVDASMRHNVDSAWANSTTQKKSNNLIVEEHMHLKTDGLHASHAIKMNVSGKIQDNNTSHDHIKLDSPFNVARNKSNVNVLSDGALSGRLPNNMGAELLQVQTLQKSQMSFSTQDSVDRLLNKIEVAKSLAEEIISQQDSLPARKQTIQPNTGNGANTLHAYVANKVSPLVEIKRGSQVTATHSVAQAGATDSSFVAVSPDAVRELTSSLTASTATQLGSLTNAKSLDVQSGPLHIGTHKYKNAVSHSHSPPHANTLSTSVQMQNPPTSSVAPHSQLSHMSESFHEHNISGHVEPSQRNGADGSSMASPSLQDSVRNLLNNLVSSTRSSQASSTWFLVTTQQQRTEIQSITLLLELIRDSINTLSAQSTGTLTKLHGSLETVPSLLSVDMENLRIFRVLLELYAERLGIHLSGKDAPESPNMGSSVWVGSTVSPMFALLPTEIEAVAEAVLPQPENAVQDIQLPESGLPQDFHTYSPAIQNLLLESLVPNTGSSSASSLQLTGVPVGADVRSTGYITQIDPPSLSQSQTELSGSVSPIHSGNHFNSMEGIQQLTTDPQGAGTASLLEMSAGNPSQLRGGKQELNIASNMNSIHPAQSMNSGQIIQTFPQAVSAGLATGTNVGHSVEMMSGTASQGVSTGSISGADVGHSVEIMSGTAPQGSSAGSISGADVGHSVEMMSGTAPQGSNTGSISGADVGHSVEMISGTAPQGSNTGSISGADVGHSVEMMSGTAPQGSNTGSISGADVGHSVEMMSGTVSQGVSTGSTSSADVGHSVEMISRTAPQGSNTGSISGTNAAVLGVITDSKTGTDAAHSVEMISGTAPQRASAGSIPGANAEHSVEMMRGTARQRASTGSISGTDAGHSVEIMSGTGPQGASSGSESNLSNAVGPTAGLQEVQSQVHNIPDPAHSHSHSQALVDAILQGQFDPLILGAMSGSDGTVTGQLDVSHTERTNRISSTGTTSSTNEVTSHSVDQAKPTIGSSSSHTTISANARTSENQAAVTDPGHLVTDTPNQQLVPASQVTVKRNQETHSAQNAGTPMLTGENFNVAETGSSNSGSLGQDHQISIQSLASLIESYIQASLGSSPTLNTEFTSQQQSDIHQGQPTSSLNTDPTSYQSMGGQRQSDAVSLTNSIQDTSQQGSFLAGPPQEPLGQTSGVDNILAALTGQLGPGILTQLGPPRFPQDQPHSVHLESPTSNSATSNTISSPGTSFKDRPAGNTLTSATAV